MSPAIAWLDNFDDHNLGNDLNNNNRIYYYLAIWYIHSNTWITHKYQIITITINCQELQSLASAQWIQTNNCRRIIIKFTYNDLQ